jgi:hypothetical protein
MVTLLVFKFALAYRMKSFEVLAKSFYAPVYFLTVMMSLQVNIQGLKPL